MDFYWRGDAGGRSRSFGTPPIHQDPFDRIVIAQANREAFFLSQPLGVRVWRRIEVEGIMSKILVTGGSGFIGCHCVLRLLAAGHQVRTTVRNLKREPDVRAMLREGGAEPGNRLSF
jgi:hypothetical protein